MRIINYKGREIEITPISFYYQEETELQEGVLVHDSQDALCDGDAIYGNGWMADSIQDESDLENLFTSGDGTTYWHKNADGTYTIDA